MEAELPTTKGFKTAEPDDELDGAETFVSVEGRARSGGTLISVVTPEITVNCDTQDADKCYTIVWNLLTEFRKPNGSRKETG